MNRRKLSHVVAAGILAALLMLPGPVMAQPTHHRVPVDLWSWLAGLWGREVSGLGAGGVQGQKAGLGIDPNGGTPTGPSKATGPSTPPSGDTLQGDQGLGIDPNG